MPPDAKNFEHLQWKRLPNAAHRKTRPNPVSSRFPFRSNPSSHGQILNSKSKNALETALSKRQNLGISPENLVVLEMSFLEVGQREHLQKLGIEIVNEEEKRTPLPKTFYDVVVRFKAATDLQKFQKVINLARLGAAELVHHRSSTGAADSKKLSIRFERKDSADNFIRKKQDGKLPHFEVLSKSAIKVSHKKIFRILTQFPDSSAIRRFKDELQNYELLKNAALTLTANQRRELFDALDDIRGLLPEDRMGEKLKLVGHTEHDDRYFDIDLWNPGKESAREAVKQLEALVDFHKGRVTDRPQIQSQSGLLLARVKGSSDLLNALLSFDLVALVDLPPVRDIEDYGVFSEIELPGTIPQLDSDSPLACIIDSGLVAGHPLLRGIVVDERDFDSGENSPVDRVGHGTHIAGIIAYGNIQIAIAGNSWNPKVRLLSAKVMRKSEYGNVAEFADEKRVETQIREAIKYFSEEYDCRVFNLSLGHQFRQYTGGRQLPWANALDEISREFDVVCVISAGNVSSPTIPQTTTSVEFQSSVREQLLEQDHSLIDPATALLSLTVGAIAHSETPYARPNDLQSRTLVGSPQNAPSPFTRCGTLHSDGGAPKRAIKPELVGPGGNYSVAEIGGWKKNDPSLGVPSLKFDFQGRRLLSAQNGTSQSAGYVTHCASIVEHEMRQQLGPTERVSANLIRCLTVHGASVDPAVKEWIGASHSTSTSETRVLRMLGYGLPAPERSSFSTDGRVNLIAQDRVEENFFHLYELELPEDFVVKSGRRSIRATLAYDPPTKVTRKEYLGRTMWFKVYRGLSSERIFNALAKAEGTGDIPKIPSKYEIKSRPPFTSLQWSTVQSATFESIQKKAFHDYRSPTNGSAIIHVLVGCTSRFPCEPDQHQTYALALSIEHSDEQIRLYQAIKQKIAQTVRVRIPTS